MRITLGMMADSVRRKMHGTTVTFVRVFDLNVSPRPGEVLAGPDQPAVAFSPAVSNLVYVATGGGTQQLYLRPMDSLEARPHSQGRRS